ncbi:unnamed protein product, partial [Didymodactylos carnosus]
MHTTQQQKFSNRRANYGLELRKPSSSSRTSTQSGSPSSELKQLAVSEELVSSIIKIVLSDQSLVTNIVKTVIESESVQRLVESVVDSRMAQCQERIDRLVTTNSMDEDEELGVQVHETDIYASHRLGKKLANRSRPLIVRFLRYKTRQE